MSIDKKTIRPNFELGPNGNTVLVTVASTIVITIVVQLWNWMKRPALDVASGIFKNAIDAIYAQAPSGLQEETNFIIIVGLSTAIVGSMLVLLFSQSSRIIHLRKDLGEIFSDETYPKFILDTRNLLRSTKLLRIWTITYLLVFVPYSAYETLMFAVVGSAQDSYRRDVQAISPVLSDMEIKQINSRWALISTKDDYESLMTWISTTAKSRHTALPPRKI